MPSNPKARISQIAAWAFKARRWNTAVQCYAKLRDRSALQRCVQVLGSSADVGTRLDALFALGDFQQVLDLGEELLQADQLPDAERVFIKAQMLAQTETEERRAVQGVHRTGIGWINRKNYGYALAVFARMGEAGKTGATLTISMYIDDGAFTGYEIAIIQAAEAGKIKRKDLLRIIDLWLKQLSLNQAKTLSRIAKSKLSSRKLVACGKNALMAGKIKTGRAAYRLARKPIPPNQLATCAMVMLRNAGIYGVRELPEAWKILQKHGSDSQRLQARRRIIKIARDGIEHCRDLHSTPLQDCWPLDLFEMVGATSQMIALGDLYFDPSAPFVDGQSSAMDLRIAAEAYFRAGAQDRCLMLNLYALAYDLQKVALATTERSLQPAPSLIPVM